MESKYDPKSVDAKWYKMWDDLGLFCADPSSDKPPFCVVIPPPNVTGVLHIGHALTNTIQDIIVRWKRMSGYEVLWVPGTDHAGIATQTVVERHLMKTTGKHRRDFTREEFLKHVWEWKEKNGDIIIQQLKKLGCSCDWSRLRFTMDDGCNKAVKRVFKMMFDEGLIYRGDYLVNWDPVTQTALGDDEVEYEERQSFLWHFKYPLADGSGHINIATTRPETMLGDTAVAVNPHDERYQHLKGTSVLLPITNRTIPIIEDHHIDPKFGTGAVKITPAHDPNDYQMGLNHNLSFINILTSDGHINNNGGRFSGMTTGEARSAVVAEMKRLGLFVKEEPHTHRVGISYRSKAAIEPYLSKQWFVRMDKFAKQLHNAVEEEEVKLTPKDWKHTYFHWINHLRDWCISRQLWWGHQIPIWYNKADPEKMICYDGDGLPPEVKAAPDEWRQDDDVLDTWFSSALWPFSALGWPEETAELQKFYPNSLLVTGHDILFFWVARMIMMGKYTQGKGPFPETFLHGLIFGKSYWRKDPAGGIAYVSPEERKEYELGKSVPKEVYSKWEKLSKSKGNVIDSQEIIEEYGTDAMRMALCASSPQSPQIDLDKRRFEEYKNFTNKVWNGARFIFLNLKGNEEKGLDALSADDFAKGINIPLLALEDRWILSRMNRANSSVNHHLSQYSLDHAATAAYDFFWKELCAYYLEITKPVLFGKAGSKEERTNKQKILLILLCNAVRLLHPMAPFITEELFQLIKEQYATTPISDNQDPYTRDAINALKKRSCMIANYPQTINPKDINEEVETAFDLINEAVYTIRNIRGEMKLPPGTSVDIHIVGDDQDPTLLAIQKNISIIKALVRTNNFSFHKEIPPSLGFSSTGTIGAIKIVVPLPQELKEEEQKRLAKEIDKLKAQKERAEKQLANTNFVNNAPQELVEKQKALLEKTRLALKEREG
ncbi:valine--tRNA ligase [Simkania negevensis]|uniref:Valine--tRNA ligase n=1 Tax=Simkania negevensis TaxID=83561 RepID=A0ABS3APF5_9BACT|nr:valine--tRNA ligase [Simkania negevensis]